LEDNTRIFLDILFKLVSPSNKNRFLRMSASISIILVLLGSAGAAPMLTVIPASALVPGSEESDGAVTPLQQQIKDLIAELKNEGKAYPDVAFESVVEQNDVPAVSTLETDNAIVTTIKAKTVVEFDTPAEAGKSRWDDIIVDSEDEKIRDQLRIKGNLTQMVIDKYPELYGAGGVYTYGQEPRTLVIEETLSVTSVHVPTVSNPVGAMQSTSTTTSSDIVMGFTIIQSVDYTLRYEVKVLGFCIVCARAGFAYDLNFGLRLPAEVDVTTPKVLGENQQYTFTSSLRPLDFSAEDYERLGVPPLGGNEAIANFSMFLGLKLTVTGVTVIDLALEPDIDLIQLCSEYSGRDCGNFVTPFGVDENGIQREFPLPEIRLDPDLTGLKIDIGIFSIGLGIKIDPDFGSDKITADWTATQSGQGSGGVTYTGASPSSFDIGPVQTKAFVNQPGANNNVTLSIDNYKYYLTKQTLTLAANLQLKLFSFRLINTSYVDFLSIELSDILGEPAIGQHEGTDGVRVELPILGGGGVPIDEFTVTATPSSGYSPLQVTFNHIFTNGDNFGFDLPGLALSPPSNDACAPVYVSGDENHDDLVNIGETWRWSCSATINETTTVRIFFGGCFGEPLLCVDYFPEVTVTILPIGGEILGVDTASLVIAGAAANSSWLVPVAAGVATSIGFVLRRRIKSYK
jgi:hypothetical protein